MAKIDILDAHKNCLDFLLCYQSEHKDFYFVPRRYNNLHRLEAGMYFIGNETYMMISFWNGGDKNEKVHNINFGVSNYGTAYIELSSCDKTERAEYLEELVGILENKFTKKYTILKSGKWEYCYPDTMNYLDALESFIENEKLVIDDYIKTHLESGIEMLSSEFDDKYVKSLVSKAVVDYKKFKAKKTGAAKIKASDYIMTFQHNELSNEMVKYLKTHGYTDVVAENGYVDITCRNAIGKKMFFELKTATTVKAAIRQALGQLLEYNHYPNKNNADKLIIVTVLEMTKEESKYLVSLRKIYNMPVWYQQFNMDKKELSKEY